MNRVQYLPVPRSEVIVKVNVEFVRKKIFYTEFRKFFYIYAFAFFYPRISSFRISYYGGTFHLELSCLKETRFTKERCCWHEILLIALPRFGLY